MLRCKLNVLPHPHHHPRILFAPGVQEKKKARLARFGDVKTGLSAEELAK